MASLIKQKIQQNRNRRPTDPVQVLSLMAVMKKMSNKTLRNYSPQKTTKKNPYILKDRKGIFFL